MARHTELQTWLDDVLRRKLDRVSARRAPALPAPTVLVETPDARFTYGDDRPWHTASIGKVFTAALIGGFVDEGRLTLDTPIGKVLPAADIASLPAAPGVDPAAEITVEHLLTHRSGLPDPFLPSRGHDTACSLKSLATQPDRVWTTRAFLAEASALPPIGRPGERFHYSDAGFALLLLVAEAVGDAPADDLLRAHVFEPSGMTDTRRPDFAAAPEADIAPMWLDRTEVSRTRALSIGSVDGGGITTAADLVRFHRALHGGRLVSPALLAHLSRPRSRLRSGIHYGAGLVTLRFGAFMPLLLAGLPEPVGGLGLTAAHAFHYPARDAHVVLNFHSTREMNRSFGVHIAIAQQLGRLAR